MGRPDKWELALRSDMAGFRHDPWGCVSYTYPWKRKNDLGDLSDYTIRSWQRAVLSTIGKHLADPSTRYSPCQIAVASGHGVGKSALVAWVCHWALSTCEDTRIVITANTATQLDTKTVPEIAKWFGMALNRHWFHVKATSVAVAEQSHARQWRADFIPWSENNTEAFAGLHNKGKRIVVIFDEASSIADRVWEVIEGAMTDAETEIIWLVFGNPTLNTGRFRECFGRLKHRWYTAQVDSRKVQGTNKEQIANWINDYGEDSDFVRVRVKGEFPRAGSTQLIPGDIVASCRRFEADHYDTAPRIMAVDVARFGDDQTVIGVRQGRRFFIVNKYRGLSLSQTAERVIDYIDKDHPDAVVIDGDGMGAGVVDHLEYRGYTDRIFEFHGGESPDDTNKYFNKRAEVWGRMCDALRAGMQLPDDPELEVDLTGPQYGYNSKQQIQLEKKEDMKKRGLASPDLGDCLAMTFGVSISLPKVNKLVERANQIPDISRRMMALSIAHATKKSDRVPIRRPNWRPR